RAGVGERALHRARAGRPPVEHEQPLPRRDLPRRPAPRTGGAPVSGTGTVFLIDDDPGVLRALTRLLRASGREVRAFASQQEFLGQHDPAAPGCLVLDVAMPERNGLDLQRDLAASGAERAVVFITGHGDVPTSVRAMKAGAVDFLTKPFDDRQLLGAVQAALEKDEAMRRARAERRSIQEKLATLTSRERQVLERVVAG